MLTGRDWLGGQWLGARLWQLVRPLAGPTLQWPEPLRSLGLGLLWSLMPCGLLYSLVLVAISTGNALSGALVMGAFGLGTLPALLGFALGGAVLGRPLREGLLRPAVGALALFIAGWTLVVALGVAPAHRSPTLAGAHHPLNETR
jgi:hypothetical protein